MSGDGFEHLENQFACHHSQDGRCDQTKLSMDMNADGLSVIVAHGDQQDVVKMAAYLVAAFMDQIGVSRLIAIHYLLSAPKTPRVGP